MAPTKKLVCNGFRTSVRTDRTMMWMAKEYVDQWKDYLSGLENVFVMHPNGEKVKVQLNLTSERPYMTADECIIRKFNMSQHVYVHFRFNKQLKVFVMDYIEECECVKDVVEISFVSKDEAINDSVLDASECNGVSWKKTLTTSDVSKKKQVMHFPIVVKELFEKHKVKAVTFKLEDGSGEYQCEIMSSKRKQLEKYVGKGWYQLVDDCNFGVGDKLTFRLEENGGVINVAVKRVG